MQIRNKVTVTGHVNQTFINFIKFLEPNDLTDGCTTQAMQIRNMTHKQNLDKNSFKILISKFT